MTVLVRYWAAARDAAGRAEEHVSAATLGTALDAVRARHADRPELARLLAVCSFVVDERPAGALGDMALRDDSVIEVLPPFAGG